MLLNRLPWICLNLDVRFDSEMNLNYFKLTIFGTRSDFQFQETGMTAVS